jgi:hypothetical protein
VQFDSSEQNLRDGYSKFQNLEIKSKFPNLEIVKSADDDQHDMTKDVIAKMFKLLGDPNLFLNSIENVEEYILEEKIENLNDFDLILNEVIEEKMDYPDYQKVTMLYG